MKYLVFGKFGQVASELDKCGDVLCLSSSDADLKKPNVASSAILKYRPSAIINAAAYTDVDGAEQNSKDAFQLNYLAVQEMATAAKILDIPLIHFSSDYVFNGKSDLDWTEGDIPDPLNNYGKSKLAGEKAIIVSNCKYAIIRTSWVFSSKSNNFIFKILAVAKQNKSIKVVDDQIGGPTSASSLANTAKALAQEIAKAPEKSGIYHYSGQPFVSRARFAAEILKIAKVDVLVESVKTTEQKGYTPRPLNSKLKSLKIHKYFNVAASDWRSDISEIIDSDRKTNG